MAVETGCKRTALYDLHVKLGAKMVPFAGWEMPVQYPMGVLREHLHTRTQAGLFDVSHMGQVILPATAVAALEALVPVDIAGLGLNRQRYAMFTTPEGGISDDLMVTNRGDHLFLVVNAARAEADIAHLRAHVPGVQVVEGRGVLALQGPAAETVLARFLPEVVAMRFLHTATFLWRGIDLWVSRSGYTGEDGFEISIPEAVIEPFAEALLAQPEVAPIGLGARDSLRLEAGLPLYGHDIDTTTSPVEAGLAWAIQKVRRAGGAREGAFPGAERILRDLAEGPARKRIGLRPLGRAPMREGVEIYAAETGGAPLGAVTSGGFGPSVDGPIATAYLPADLSPGTTVYGDVRGKRLAASVVSLPFHPTTYKR